METVTLICGHFVGANGSYARAFCGGLREFVAQDLYRHIEDLMRREAGILTSLETVAPAPVRKGKRG